MGGLYINISLGDYLRAIQGVHEKDMTWTFDPRMEIEKIDQKEAVPCGMGNQASCEFNLLYRFHSAISEADDQWTNEFFQKCLTPTLEGKKLTELTPDDMHTMMNVFAAEKSRAPETREFGNLKRGSDGRFNDAELTAILKSKIDDPAGVFGAKHVPKSLRVVEMAGIVAARKWEVASLNEFRTFFGMEPHKTFESINNDKKIAAALRELYDSPNMVEMYRGIFIEGIESEAKGIRFPPTAGRGVLSDAVTLVRSDRFYAIDYTTATLTNWGLCEAASDYKTLGGSMFHKLLHRGLPGWSDFNSVHVMQPMYASKKNKEIYAKLGSIDQFSQRAPGAPKAPEIVKTHAGISKLLESDQKYALAWTPSPPSISPPGLLTAYSSFQQSFSGDQLYQHVDLKVILLDYATSKATAYLERDGFELRNSWYQIDFIREYVSPVNWPFVEDCRAEPHDSVAIPVNVHLLADLFCLDVKTTSNEDGAHSASELYKMLLEVRAWLDAPDPDHASKWYKRRKAEEHSGPLTESTKAYITQLDSQTWGDSIKSVFGFGATKAVQNPTLLRDVGAILARDALKKAKKPEEAARLMWMLAVTGVGSPVTAVSPRFRTKPRLADTVHLDR